MPFTPEHQARIDAGRRATYARRRVEWDALSRAEQWDRVLKAFALEFSRRFAGYSMKCWPWNEYCEARNTYGTFSRMGLGDYTHRLSYRLAHGSIPEGLVVRHTCDYRPCVNPQHLLIGTHADNMGDARDRGRLSPVQKITDAQVRELDARYRAGGVSMTALAREYGISVPLTSEIINRKKRARAFTVA